MTFKGIYYIQEFLHIPKQTSFGTIQWMRLNLSANFSHILKTSIKGMQPTMLRLILRLLLLLPLLLLILALLFARRIRCNNTLQFINYPLPFSRNHDAYVFQISTLSQNSFFWASV